MRRGWSAVLCLAAAVVAAPPPAKVPKLSRKDGVKLRHSDKGPDVHKGTEHIDVPVKITPIFERRLYGQYGKKAKDHQLPAFVNDFGSGLQLKKPIAYLGKEYATIYVLSNGALSFDEKIPAFTKRILELEQPIIAPYWARNDLQRGGAVFYREELYNRGILQRGEAEIRFHFNVSVKAESAFIATWEDMQPRLKHNRLIKRKNWNKIQAVLFTTDKGTFANFIYGNVGWGARALGGFSDGGNGTWLIPGMGTQYPMVHGNTGIPGEWMFMIHKEDGVVYCKKGYSGDKCDERCGAGSYGYDCSQICDCGERLCHKESGLCLTEEEEAAENIDWAAIIGPIEGESRRRRRRAVFY